MPAPSSVLANRDALEHLYHVVHRSLRGVARELGCSRTAVRAAVERQGIALLPPTRGRPPELDDRQWLYRAYHGQRRPAQSIAEELGCSVGVVLAALHRMDIVTRPKRPRPSPRLADADFLRQRYWEEGRSIVGIANELACSPGAVRSALFRHGIPVRSAGAPRIEQLYDREWLADASARMTAAEIAEALECSEVTVRWALWRGGIAPGQGRPRRPAALDDLTFLFRTYVIERRSARSIAAEVGCAPATVLQALRRHGLAVRSSQRQLVTDGSALHLTATVSVLDVPEKELASAS